MKVKSEVVSFPVELFINNSFPLVIWDGGDRLAWLQNLSLSIIWT